MDLWHHVKVWKCNVTFLPCDSIGVILEAEAFSYEESAGLVGFVAFESSIK